MSANYYIIPEAIATDSVANRGEALEKLARLFADAYALDFHQVLEALEEREALGSTGFGRGVAIPHARVAGIIRPSAAVLRPEKPIDFDSADGMPVNLVIGMLSPDGAGITHLHALAAISRMVRDEDIRDALASAPDPDALFALITNAVDSDAA